MIGDKRGEAAAAGKGIPGMASSAIDPCVRCGYTPKVVSYFNDFRGAVISSYSEEPAKALVGIVHLSTYLIDREAFNRTYLGPVRAVYGSALDRCRSCFRFLFHR
jgi:hypothetical protein